MRGSNRKKKMKHGARKTFESIRKPIGIVQIGNLNLWLVITNKKPWPPAKTRKESHLVNVRLHPDILLGVVQLGKLHKACRFRDSLCRLSSDVRQNVRFGWRMKPRLGTQRLFHLWAVRDRMGRQKGRGRQDSRRKCQFSMQATT